ncbi:hypothetical protein P9112_005658 [Eukaryota sp. TZLM1-RC]
MPSVASLSSSLTLSFSKSLNVKHKKCKKQTIPVDSPSEHHPKWNKAKNQAVIRENCLSNATCCICLDGFSSNKVTLLLCSHIFHPHCLAFFEQYSSSRTCPLCRQHYEEKLSSFDPKLHLSILSAIKIQSAIRGCLARWKVRKTLNQVKLLPKKQQRQFVYESMADVCSRFLTPILSFQMQVDQMISSIDKDILLQRDLLRRALYSSENQTEVDWQSIKQTVINRLGLTVQSPDTVEACPICLGDIKLSCRGLDNSLVSLTSGKSSSLLSCCHFFHSNCLRSLEKFSHSSYSCPVCRKYYSKIEMEY